MATSAAAIRNELEENLMYIGKGLLKDPDNADFVKKVTTVMKSDRKSVVNEEELANYQANYKKYRLSNEETFVWTLLPIMMPAQFTAQNVTDDGSPFGEYKTCGFPQQGVVTSVNHLFRPYCLPHRLINASNIPMTSITEHFDKSKALTTPKPDFTYSLMQDKLPKAPADIKVSERVYALLDVAPTLRDIFFIWENKSGGGIPIKCENQALRDASAVIHARRQLHQYVVRNTTPGIDQDTCIDAATNDNTRLYIWVAFAWLPKDLSRVEFHMEKIGSMDFSMDELEQDKNILANIRKPLHNISRVGVNQENPGVEAIL
ncbi:MAG: hypothetical protein Q9220_007211 [cf. Caloplaca sp. 1 TL-2023]